MQYFKILAIGDDAAEKVQLLTTFIEGKCPKEYIPTVFENSTKTLKIRGKQVILDLWDSTGFDNLPSMRQPLYSNVDIILVCYSVVNKNSFINVKNKWYPEMKSLCPHTPFFLIATQSEKRNKCSEVKNHLISTGDGLQLSKELNAIEFIECSAKNNENVDYIFEQCIKVLSHDLHNQQSHDQQSLYEDRSTFIFCYLLFLTLSFVSLIIVSK
ncbi:Rho family GTPase [Entamoeba histolytica HM-1:IMSS-B]|uniref:small monomeric GTPase n=6 Tax=Entamoeba histolytica TaxID=5759 RepID=C4LW15_ENTH1|nr:Rho family GTPase [Entamoeba histolytica HM-1:IMSS]EMD48150.1 Rho family GTPase, putative [Entamoeba histolytica KU27]EMH74081.1 Rho family GTPase [Entamoeba histolytica HM-1:IMSS-B]EMS15647.1 Rho family GTPase [Entamoeba histolytica HM-3:IMSS]ENY63861.1 Rho family GTPase, putative [Entamoeba histolytica HM-1:IMSS-A]GAT92877.1 Rho family GTPase [Entamoeba histolytica]|eukprot:XP_652457.1 Rho family GTPase [Entamoeba histolytica HM-1:IMSS]